MITVPPRHRPVGLLLALGLAGAWGLPRLAAQLPERTYGAFLDRVDVEVVNVDVVALDRAGQPVVDLTRDELELRVDGQPVAIDFFSAPAGAPSAAPASAPGGPDPAVGATPSASAPPSPLSLVVYFDLTGIRPGPRNQAADAVRQFLDQRLPPGSRALVAVHGEGLRLLTELTDDRATLARAIDDVKKMPSAGARSEVEERALLGDLLTAPTTGQAADAEAERLRSEIEMLGQEQASRQRRATAALADLVSSLGGVEGRKALLLASGGFLSRPAARLGEVWQGRFGSLASSDRIAVGESDPESGALRNEFARLLRAAQAARVTFFTIDAGDRRSGLPDAEFSGTAEAASSTAGIAADLESGGNLGVLAAATGGRAFRAQPELAESFAALAADLAGTYSLGFATGEEAGGGFHEIEIRCRREGVRLRHREGYRRRPPGEQMTDTVLAAAAFGLAANPLGAVAQAGEPRAAARGRSRLVPVRVAVPLRQVTLLPEGANQVGRLRFHFALRDDRSRLVTLESRELPVTVPNARLATALGQRVTFEVEIPLAPGRHQLAVAVHDELGDGRSTLLVPIEVPKER